MDLIFKIENESEFERAVQEVVLNCYNTYSSSNDAAKEEIKTLILQTNCEGPKLNKSLSQKDYDKDRVLFLLDMIESKKSELLYLTLTNYNSKYGEAVSNFKWALKLVNGTSELQNLKYPLLQLSFTVYENGQQSQKSFDVSRDMLSKLIDVLDTKIL